MNHNILFISGIGTDIGKTFAVARLLHVLHSAGKAAASFKLVQTGAAAYPSPDIVVHRGGVPNMEDMQGGSCGATYPLPASPHLAAEAAGESVNPTAIWEKLLRYATIHTDSLILCEGAGGVFSPLTRQMLTADFIAEHRLPQLLIAHAGLGSIHSTLAALEALDARSLLPNFLLFNPYPTEPEAIAADNERFLREWCAAHYPQLPFLGLSDTEAILKALLNFENDSA